MGPVRETHMPENKADQDRPAPIERASGGQANADKAAETAPGDRQPGEDMRKRQEKLVDEGVEETFPASDPVSVKRIT
jgi:hypothetical protein